MALQDKVIVSARHLMALYEGYPTKESVAYLVDNGFLPLTVESFTTQRGQALLELATWVYFSGFLDGKQFTPHVCKSKEELEDIIKPLFSRLDIKGTPAGNSSSARLYVGQYGGIVGRLFYAMGIPQPEYQFKGVDKVTKVLYRPPKLPHYMHDIDDSIPKNREESNKKRFLIKVLCGVLLKDRLEVNRNGVRLRLNRFKQRRYAYRHALEIIDLLNQVYRDRMGVGMFSPQQARAYPDKQAANLLYSSFVRVEGNQLLRMARQGTIEIGVNYPN